MFVCFIFGFLAGFVFTVAFLGFSNWVRLYLHFNFFGGLVSLQEAKCMIAEGGHVFLIRGSPVFRILILPKDAIDLEYGHLPHVIIPQALLLNKMYVSKRFLQRHFPEVEVRCLNMSPFGGWWN